MGMDVLQKEIKSLLKKCKLANYRSLFIILNSEGSEQIPLICELLARDKKCSILWCSKENSDELINENRTALYKRLAQRRPDTLENDTSESSAFFKSYFCSYSDVQGMLYQPFNVVILQDFEEVTPLILASVTNMVKGGGVLLVLLHKIETLEDISSVCMNSCSTIKPLRFSQRFASSFSSFPCCLILDRSLNVLSPNISMMDFNKEVNNKKAGKKELLELKAHHQNDLVISALINICQTCDQAKLLLKFLDVLKKRTLNSRIAVSSSKGRGKSAALGLAIAGSVAFNYSNIFISSLYYDNVKILFRFLLKGLNALNYKEDGDYDLIESVNPKFGRALIGVNVFKDHPQAIRFIFPTDVEGKLEQAELVVVDDAATIPLALLKYLVCSHVVLMASTTNGYGSTGQSLYENVLTGSQQSICQEKYIKSMGSAISSATTASAGQLEKLFLEEPIHYASGDYMEKWVNRLLCLESTVSSSLSSGCPVPEQCNLYYVSQETLFSNQFYAENFLQHLMSHFAASKRTILPDYLLKIADDPNYHVFCLLPPTSNSKKTSPEILCAILVHVEYKIPRNIVYSGSNQTDFVTSCLMDWRKANENSEDDFEPKWGIHILDFVTHPLYRRMGYGLRAFQLLQDFYEGKWISLDESPVAYSEKKNISFGKEPENDATSLPPLLLQLSEIQPEKVEYFLISYYLASNLLRFWKKAGFAPIFVTKEMSTAGEYLCFMLKSLDKDFDMQLHKNCKYFREYYFILLHSSYKKLSSSFALSLLRSLPDNQMQSKVELTKADIDIYFKPRNMKSLERYCHSLGDFHCIIPSIPILSKLYFRNCFRGIDLPFVQQVILLSFGLQRKTVDEISKELSLPLTQVHGLLNRTIRKLVKYLTDIIEKTVEKSIVAPKVIMEPIPQDLDEELEEAAQKIQKQQIEESKKLMDMDFSQYAIKGSEDDWQKALHSGRRTLVSIKSIKKKPEEVEFPKPTSGVSFKGKHKHVKRKR